MERQHLAVFVGLSAALVFGCEDKNLKQMPTASAPAAPVAAPAKSAEVKKSPLRLLAKSADALRLAGQNGSGIVLAGKHGLVLRDGKLAEHPTFGNGLENPKWSELSLLSLGEELAVLAGKRDPADLWTGDFQMYMEDKEIGPDRTVFRAFKKGNWVRVGAVKEGETFRDLGRYRGRIVSPVEMAGGTDYRFVLVAGKPGIALPAPGSVPKKKEPEPEEAPAVEEAPASDAGSADGAAEMPEAAAPAKPEPSAKEEKAEEPPDPNLPQPESDECATRLVPRAFDGLEDGEAYLVGRACQNGAFWVEHWPAGKRKSTFEKLPAQPSEDAVMVAATVSGEAYLAERGSRLLLFRSGGAWKKIEPPGSGNLQKLVASPAGRIWVIADGHVFSRKGDAAWSELSLPEGKRASDVLPADGELTLVAADGELYGPPNAGPAEVVSIAKGATILCQEPYVVVERKIKRTKRYPEVVEKVKKAGVAGVELVFGHRGMAGEDSIQAKVKDMKTAQALSKALGGADIACGAPRTEAQVPGF